MVCPVPVLSLPFPCLSPALSHFFPIFPLFPPFLPPFFPPFFPSFTQRQVSLWGQELHPTVPKSHPIAPQAMKSPSVSAGILSRIGIPPWMRSPIKPMQCRSPGFYLCEVLPHREEKTFSMFPWGIFVPVFLSLWRNTMSHGCIFLISCYFSFNCPVLFPAWVCGVVVVFLGT